MNSDEKWVLIEATLDKLDKMNKHQRKVSNEFGLDVESILMKSFNDIFEIVIEVVTALIDDKNDWIEWYIYENDYGRSGLKTTFDDGNIVISVKTVKDLRRVVELSDEL